MTYTQAIDRAKRAVINSGREAVFVYVCRDLETWYELWGECEYHEAGRVDDCVAVAWSYVDDSGRLAAALETEEDWQ